MKQLLRFVLPFLALVLIIINCEKEDLTTNLDHQVNESSVKVNRV